MSTPLTPPAGQSDSHRGPGTPPLRVVVVDDDPIVRGSVSAVLGKQPDMTLVGTAADGDQAVALVRRQPVDIAVMDIQMPVLNGIEAAEQIFALSPQTKVLLLTTFDTDQFLNAGLAAGVSGFLLKTTHPSEVAEAVRAIARGGKVVSPGPTRRLVDRMVARQEMLLARSRPSEQDIDLSSREREVLTLLCRARSNQQIAQEIGIAEATVKTHVSALMRKMGVHSRLEIVIEAQRLGLIRAR